MAQTKQKLVIKPKSVHVAQAFDIAFPVSEQSVFSDSYDWETERKRLSGLSDEESGALPGRGGCMRPGAGGAGVSNWRLAGASRRSLACAYPSGWTTILRPIT